MFASNVQGFAPVQPNQTFGRFVVLSVGTGGPVEVEGRVVAKGSVLYDWKSGRTMIVQKAISSEISPKARPFSVFKSRIPKDSGPELPEQTSATAKRRIFRIFAR